MYRAVLAGLMLVASAGALAVERVAKFDTDKDLHVNYVELTDKCKVSKVLFEKADKDSDNVLSEKEMRTAKAYLFSKCKKESKES